MKGLGSSLNACSQQLETGRAFPESALEASHFDDNCESDSASLCREAIQGYRKAAATTLQSACYATVFAARVHVA